MMRLTGRDLDVAGLWQVASERAPCTLSEESRGAMAASRALVLRLAAEPRAVYGINTGFGPLSGHRVALDEQAQHQLNLLHHLSVGQGPLFDPVETRAIVLARVNSLARGQSGLRAEVLDLLLRALDCDLLPEIPQEGSVGASGDLVPLAHMARLVVGLGHARLAGERVRATEGLERCGLQALELGPKEGLALVNGTSGMTGLAALSVHDAQRQIEWAELLSACLFQALSGEPEVLYEGVHRARGHAGQILSAARIAAELNTQPDFAARIAQGWDSGAKPLNSGVEIQDPYSLRCSPQVLGAVRGALEHVRQVVEQELNATTDNPLIFAEPGWVIHAGNFYGQQVSLASDYLRTAMISVGLLAERQLDRLTNWRYSRGLPELLAGGAPGLNSGFAGCQLLATSLAADLRMLGGAASIQTIPTNANNQDVVSMGMTAARATRRALELNWKVLGILALALAQAADQRGAVERQGEGYRALHARVRALSPRLDADRPLFDDLRAVSEMIRTTEAPAPAA